MLSSARLIHGLLAQITTKAKSKTTWTLSGDYLIFKCISHSVSCIFFSECPGPAVQNVKPGWCVVLVFKQKSIQFLIAHNIHMHKKTSVSEHICNTTYLPCDDIKTWLSASASLRIIHHNVLTNWPVSLHSLLSFLHPVPTLP